MPDIHALRLGVPPEVPVTARQPVAKGLSFEMALQFIKLGYRATRPVWGEGTILIGPSFDADPAPAILHDTSAGRVPWSATQADILAHDWTVFDAGGVEITA